MKKNYGLFILLILIFNTNECFVNILRNCCKDSTIKVTGKSIVFGFPDKAIIKFSFTYQG
jgi:hypothetical protein